MKLQLKYLNKYLFIIILALLSTGCGIRTASTEHTDNSAAAKKYLNQFLQKATENKYHDYQETGGQVALVIDISSVMDNGFNQAVLEGAQTYADAAGVSYSYYSAASDSPEAYEDAVLTAIQNNGELIICAGSHFEQAVGALQNEYSDIYFLLLDGVPRDTSGSALTIASNVHCITYHEEEAGYLAGYMAVLEGYKKLGFIGGEPLPAVQKYGYGYLRGIEDAAAVSGISDDIYVDYWYSDTFFAGQEIEDVSLDWYQAGTQIIFACGGSLYQSVLSAAETCSGRLIGADVDQNDISELFLTSAMKGIDSSVIVALDEFYANGGTWPEELAGTHTAYGAEEKCIGLPCLDDKWRFKTATLEDYLQILSALKTGEIQISDSIDTVPETTVSVTFHD